MQELGTLYFTACILGADNEDFEPRVGWSKEDSELGFRTNEHCFLIQTFSEAGNVHVMVHHAEASPEANQSLRSRTFSMPIKSHGSFFIGVGESTQTLKIAIDEGHYALTIVLELLSQNESGEGSEVLHLYFDKQ